MSKILPFPRVRDRRYVVRHAHRMALLPERTAEKHLSHQLNIQVETMHRRGIDPETIEQHRRALEVAIRAECWRLSMTGGVA